ncbi:MAG: YoaK family protein [Lachnospiraceae bacterium]|nr:YoaK family protein [Lachnospiraceae bacterium]
MLNHQMSDSFRLGAVLAASGGFMDAYSYLCRDEVFANAQTGNMLLLGIHISEKNWPLAMRYFFPVFAFTIGIVLADMVRYLLHDRDRLHWRQLAVVFEAMVLLIVCFIPQKWNLLANSLTSLACGIQVESFRKIHGTGVATTMCIGNLRGATQNLLEYAETHDKRFIRRSILYFGIIFCFVCGAIIGNFCVGWFAEKAIAVCVFLLLLSFLMMFVDGEKDVRKK